ncbi:MAG: hypothetical protein H9535_01185 [Ignavibacteria bacterium]|nr:hypothetical protein [Ignavibacteria bacterium]MBL7993608.1 hypothetical protein [Candidatus Kapabacteria bacterium]
MTSLKEVNLRVLLASFSESKFTFRRQTGIRYNAMLHHARGTFGGCSVIIRK